MRFIRADKPDACVLRRHGVQTLGNRFGVVAVGQVRRIQRMFDRHAQHGIHQPFNIVHITGDRGITEIQVQYMGDLIKIALLDAFAA
ncbi:hypothetical protein D3C76_1420930 [compost metagenome]